MIKKIYAIISTYPDNSQVCWGNYDTRAEARHACKNDNQHGDRVGKVFKFVVEKAK